MGFQRSFHAILGAVRYYIPQEGGKNIQKQKGHRSELDVGEQDMESLLAKWAVARRVV